MRFIDVQPQRSSYFSEKLLAHDKTPQRGVIRREARHPEGLPMLAAISAMLLKSLSG
jgi:hypothetical protein